jgi:hypothetical protein
MGVAVSKELLSVDGEDLAILRVASAFLVEEVADERALADLERLRETIRNDADLAYYLSGRLRGISARPPATPRDETGVVVEMRR